MGRDGYVIVGVLAFVTVGLIAWQAVSVVSFLPTATRAFWLLAALALLSDLQALRVGDRGPYPVYVFVSVCFTFAVLLIYGLAPAVCLQVLAGLIGVLRLRLSVPSATLIIARLVLALTAAAYVLHLSEPRIFKIGERVGRPLLWYIIAAAVTWYVVYYLTLVIVVRLHTHFAWRILLGRTFGYELFATLALLFLAPVLVGEPQGYLFTLLAIPVLAVGQIARLLTKQQQNLQRDPTTGVLSARGLVAEFGRMGDVGGLRNATKPTVGLSIVRVEEAGQVRDLFGRRIGDGVLAAAAARVNAVTAGSGVVGRVSGDEFVVLTTGRDALTVARRIREALLETGYIDNLPFDLSGRIGVAIGPEAGRDLTTLLRNADEATGTARRTGRAVAVYEPRAASESAQRMDLLTELNDALADPARRDEIGMVYQPQIAIDSGEFLSMEALVRWTTPTSGMVSSQHLIDLVEPTMLMHTLTTRVIEDVIAQVARWTASGLRFRTSINVSARDLVRTAIVERVLGAVREAGISPQQIGVEITEGALVADEPRVSQAVAQLADAGVEVSVDDFGTGYSSLLYLRSLAVAEIKIDRGLVQRITVDSNDRSIVRTIIEMGDALGLRVIAEGVEDEATRDLLAELRCPAAQGYLYARPLAAADVPSWLDRHRSGGA